MSRFYEPVAIRNNLNADGDYLDHYGVRAQSGGQHHRIMGSQLGLDWDRADRLCDILEDVRRLALEEGVSA